MSSYIQFYIKKKGIYVPIGTYCRSSVIYRNFEADWGVLKPLTQWRLRNIMTELKEEEERFNKQIDENKLKIDFIQEANNSMEEKMHTLSDILYEIDEVQESIEEVQYAIYFVKFLDDILDECDDYNDLDADNYIYYGIECPYPDDEDIKE